MQRHCSTVGETEPRAGLARVVSLAGFRDALRSDLEEEGGGKRPLNESGPLEHRSQRAVFL